MKSYQNIINTIIIWCCINFKLGVRYILKISPIAFSFNNYRYNLANRKINFMGQDVFVKSADNNIQMKNEEVLDKILSEFKELDGVEAIGIGGSSASKKADSSSDIDIYVFTSKDIPIEQRKKIIQKYSSKYDVGQDYFGPDDEFYVDSMNKDFDIVYFDKKWIEDNYKNVWIDANPSNGYTTCFLYTLSILDVKHDKTGWLENLKTQLNTPYPKKLQENIIKRNMMLLNDKPFASYSSQLQKAVKRNDFNSVNHRITAFLESYFDIIFAKNELLHPGEKRLVQYAKAHCRILPKDFEKNVNDLVVAPIDRKTQIASKMVENLREIL